MHGRNKTVRRIHTGAPVCFFPSEILPSIPLMCVTKSFCWALSCRNIEVKVLLAAHSKRGELYAVNVRHQKVVFRALSCRNLRWGVSVSGGKIMLHREGSYASHAMQSFVACSRLRVFSISVFTPVANLRAVC